MINTIAGILLILAVGMCVVAFPFVLWMLFGSEPQAKHATAPAPYFIGCREAHEFAC